MYHDVSQCITMYQNVSIYIDMYRNISIYIERYQLGYVPIHVNPLEPLLDFAVDRQPIYSTYRKY